MEAHHHHSTPFLTGLKLLRVNEPFAITIAIAAAVPGLDDITLRPLLSAGDGRYQSQLKRLIMEKQR